MTVVPPEMSALSQSPKHEEFIALFVRHEPAIHYDPKSRAEVKFKIAELLRQKGGRSETEHRKEPTLQ